MRAARLIVETLGVLVLSTLAYAAPWPIVCFACAVVLVLWWPGRSILRALRGADMSMGRFWFSIAVSIVVVPVPLDWAWRCSNDPVALLACVAIGNVLLVWLGMLSRRPPATTPMFPNRRARFVFSVIVVWIAACVLTTYWLPVFGDGVGRTAVADYIKHHAVLYSLERQPLPLGDVFYTGEPDTPYYYHHYHHLLSATLRKLTHDQVSIAFSFGFTSAVLAAVFLAVVYLVARVHLKSSGGAVFAVATVSVIGGLDLLPALARWLAAGRSMVVTLDAWCPVEWRIHNMVTQFLWCPQHVAAALALLLAAGWLRAAPRAGWWIIMAPILGASIFGSSVYMAMVAFTAAAALVVWELVWSWRVPAARSGRMVLALVGIAVLGAALMGVQAYGYSVMSQRFGGSLTMDWPHFPRSVFGRLLSPGPIANLLNAPWVLMIDLGLGGVACVLVSRRFWGGLWRDAGMRLLIVTGLVGTFASFIVRSDVNSIDYGFRSSITLLMVVGGVCSGALFSGEHLRSFAARWRWLIIAAFVPLGLAVGLYEAPMTAVHPALDTAPRYELYHMPRLRTALMLLPFDRADAGAIQYLRDESPPDAVVQGDPEARLMLPQLIDRQMGIVLPSGRGGAHVRVFAPRNPGRMEQARDEALEAFSTGSSRRAYDLLRVLGVTHVLAGRVEQVRFDSELSQFLDANLFEPVYTDDHATVYRIVDDVEGG